MWNTMTKTFSESMANLEQLDNNFLTRLTTELRNSRNYEIEPWWLLNNENTIIKFTEKDDTNKQ